MSFDNYEYIKYVWIPYDRRSIECSASGGYTRLLLGEISQSIFLFLFQSIRLRDRILHYEQYIMIQVTSQLQSVSISLSTLVSPHTWVDWAVKLVAWHANRRRFRGWTCHANLMKTDEYITRAAVILPEIISGFFCKQLPIDSLPSLSLSLQYLEISECSKRKSPIGDWTPEVSR